ncbi:MAG: peptidoglycan-binding protein [Rhodospirillaceae bacterium]|nr:peptidoglycan-binding protein [Rhodospirillaceae bacterium]
MSRGRGIARPRTLAALARVAALAALLVAAPAAADTVIYYSAPENAYGWCAGYDLRTAHRCAYRQCARYGSRCVAVVECGGGWGAVAIAQDPYRGFAGVCGMGDSFSARGWALTNCMVTADTLCSTRVTFDRRGATASNRDNSLFDTTWLVQAVLQMRKYDPGNADGVLEERTRAAIRKFQRTIGMAETGDPYAVLNPLIDVVGAWASWWRPSIAAS